MFRCGLRVGASIGVASYSCAYTAPSRVKSWGSGQFGQLGLGQEKDEATPRSITAVDHVNPVFIAAGGTSSAIVADDGRVFTFGNGACLGMGPSAGHKSVPQQLPLDLNFKSIAVGDYHMCGLSDDGKVYTWGKAKTPQLGTSTATGAPTVVSIPAKVVQISCGRQQSVAVTADGQLYTWGVGFEGALGQGSKADAYSPTKVEGVPAAKVTAAACGREFTCVLTSEGQLWSFGANDYGQLGTGTGERFSREPKRVSGLEEQKVISISCGEFHCACLTSKGEVYSWGNGKNGQLGHGSLSDVSTPRMVDLSCLDDGPEGKAQKVTHVSCGGGHTALLTDTGRTYMFGRGRNGQLGRGDHLESVAAYRMQPLPVSLSGIAQVVCGADHTLALVSTE